MDIDTDTNTNINTKKNIDMNRAPFVLVACPFPQTMPWAYVYLKAYLKKHNENVVVIPRSEYERHNKDYEKIIQKVLDLQPIGVGFGSLYPDLMPAKEMIALLRQKDPNLPIVIGGQMVTPTPEFSLKITGADYGVIGEAEITLLRIVRALRAGESLRTIPGIVMHEDNKIVITGTPDIIENLSDLPEPAFDIYPIESWLHLGRKYLGQGEVAWRYNDKIVSVHGSRGCPYTCNFCYLHSKVRFRPVEEMIREVAENIDRYDANMIRFADELVLSNKKRAYELIENIRKYIHKPIEYQLVSRFDILDRLDDQILKGLKETGCRLIVCGIESGSPRILEVMNKKNTLEQIQRGLTPMPIS